MITLVRPKNQTLGEASIGVRTASGDWILERNYTPKERTVASDPNNTYFDYTINKLVDYDDKKRIPAGEKITAFFFENRRGWQVRNGLQVVGLFLTSKIVQPGQKTADQLNQYTHTVRDLTSFGQTATIVDTSVQTAQSAVRFPGLRPTVAVNNAYTLADDGPYVLEITAVDSDGAATTRTARLMVNNLAPTTDIAGKPTGNVVAGTQITLNASAAGAIVNGKATADPSPVDAASLRHEWKVSSPTGQIVSTTVAPTLQFVPATAGTYTVTKTSTDPQGAIDVDTVAITVLPKVVFTPSEGNLNAVEGSAVTIGLAVASSPASDRATRSYAWTVKQGATTIVSGTTSDIRFVPADNVPYTIEATLSDAFNAPAGPAVTSREAAR